MTKAGFFLAIGLGLFSVAAAFLISSYVIQGGRVTKGTIRDLSEIGHVPADLGPTEKHYTMLESSEGTQLYLSFASNSFNARSAFKEWEFISFEDRSLGDRAPMELPDRQVARFAHSLDVQSPDLMSFLARRNDVSVLGYYSGKSGVVWLLIRFTPPLSAKGR